MFPGEEKGSDTSPGHRFELLYHILIIVVHVPKYHLSARHFKYVLHFSFTFMENLYKKQPILLARRLAKHASGGNDFCTFEALTGA